MCWGYRGGVTGGHRRGGARLVEWRIRVWRKRVEEELVEKWMGEVRREKERELRGRERVTGGRSEAE